MASVGVLTRIRPKMQHTVSKVLHHDVSAYAHELRERSELLKRARSGRVNGATVVRYLDGIRYLTEQSVRLLELAAESSERRQQPELAKHYWGKRNEAGNSPDCC